MANYTKTMQQYDHATKMIRLYEGFTPINVEEHKEYFRLQSKWLRKAEALLCRLKSLDRRR